VSVSTINLNLDRGPAGQLNVEIDTGDGQFQFTELTHAAATWRPALIGPAEVALAQAVTRAVLEYRAILNLPGPPNGPSTPSLFLRLDRLEAFAGELINGAFPHLAHLVPPSHLGEAVKALKGQA
jgi:hypothetical protein